MEPAGELLCMFSGRIERRGRSFVVEIPERELSDGELVEGSVYQIGILSNSRSGPSSARAEPPVDVGDVRSLVISDLGDQGDGIGRIERGYVVIVPGTTPGEEVTVEITTVQENYAIAEVVEE